MNLPAQLMTILDALRAAGGRPLIVGGAVRDAMLGIAPKDVDVEVFGLDRAVMMDVLARFGRVDTVGASFGVTKLMTPDGADFDFSLPRRDNHNGKGHKGFEITLDGALTPVEAAARRDFTFNALAFDPFTGKLLDPFGGLSDIERRVIRHTSDHFSEDPLRVLRAMQFAARFDMTMDGDTVSLCRSIVDRFGELSRERVWGEWEKLAGKGVKPSRGLEVLRATGWIAHFPELAALIDVPQDPEWHPEGDVWTHTLHVADAAAEICDRKGIAGRERVILVLAAILHDAGKPMTTVFEGGRWRSPGHAEAGEAPARAFLERMGAPREVVEAVIPLVVCHMRHIGFSGSARVVRRLAMQVNIAHLAVIVEADHSGRPPLPKGLPDEMRRIVEMARELSVEAEKPTPILMGRHLIERGFKPGKAMGDVLRAAFEAQLDGVFDTLEGALHWVEGVRR